MKTKIFLLLFVVSSIVVFGCAQNQQASMENMNMGENGDTEFKKMCQDANYEWMYMKPTKDGKIMKEAESCWGCMVKGIEHVCDMEKFDMMMKTDMETGTHSMQHTAMTTYAGTRSSVDVHMYKVGFIRPDLQAGKEAVLKFSINDIQSKKPISDLEIIHDKIMHVVFVRNDLKHFDHIHPELSDPGVFSVPYKFSSSGTYRIWVDFTINGMQHIVDFDINVNGNVETDKNDSLDGIKINFSPSKEVVVRKETELRFEIFDKNNRPVPITEKFLAADAHLISIDETLEEFGHNHDESFDKDNILLFKHTIAKPGKYKLWIQFSKDNKTKTASFEVMVK